MNLLRRCESPGDIARIAALSADQAPTAIIGCPHMTTGAARGLERATLAAYEQPARLHIIPSLGHLELSRLSAPMVRDFEDRLRLTGWSLSMVRTVLTNLGSLLGDAQERGLVARNVVRDLGSRRKKGVERRAERRSKGRLKAGVEYPCRERSGPLWGRYRGRGGQSYLPRYSQDCGRRSCEDCAGAMWTSKMASFM
jgi:hypothetical protein